jgi:hypothetical protein
VGCDIHGVVQRQWEAGARWDTVDTIDNCRNYALFEALAGVRSRSDSPEMVAAPRGYPDGFDFGSGAAEGDYKWEDCDGNLRSTWMGDHSFSWLTLDEIERWLSADPERRERQVGLQFMYWIRWLRLRWMSGTGGVRIVFGFDN